MGSTYLSLHYHVVFSTKNRQPWIADEWRSRLFEYLGGTINGLGGKSLGVGGVEDHVHILLDLKATHCLADVMRQLKRAASVWIRDEIGVQSFYWQEGYSAFTVSATAIDKVKRYIATQAEHHRQRTFRNELTNLLARAGVEYDLRYLE